MGKAGQAIALRMFSFEGMYRGYMELSREPLRTTHHQRRASAATG